MGADSGQRVGRPESGERHSSRGRGFSLVEILVVLVVLVVLMGFAVNWYTGAGKGAARQPGQKAAPQTPKGAARGIECQSYLAQLRQAYTMATATGDENRPRTVADLRPYGVTESIARCPDGREWYRMDPTSGRISCPHPGHTGY